MDRIPSPGKETICFFLGPNLYEIEIDSITIKRYGGALPTDFVSVSLAGFGRVREMSPEEIEKQRLLPGPKKEIS